MFSKPFSKINTKIPVSLCYSKDSWNYENPNIGGLKKFMPLFNWEKGFQIILINEKIDLLNTTLVNIFRYYIKNKTIKCGFKDHLWMRKLIKSKLKQVSTVKKHFYR